MTDSQQLLADYAKNGSEAAFRELVGRYLDLVYSAAIRLVEGDTHRAQDVAQMVFADFARKARTLSSEVMIGGWLHRHTCYTASTLMRGERRRQARERQAVEMNTQTDHFAASLAQAGPVLDEAINQLGAEDRAAILLRFFERRDFREIGRALGSNEDAAQKRVSRALDKLQLLLRNRGITYSAAALGTALTAGAVSAAPAGLGLTISTAALAGTAGGGTALALLKIMTTTKLKTALLSTLAVAAMATPVVVVQHQASVKLQTENQALHQQVDRVNGLQEENQRLAKQMADERQAAALAQEQMSELLRLRGEVGSLRTQKADLDKAREEIRQLRARPTVVQAQPTTASAAQNGFTDRIQGTIRSPAETAMLNACVNNLRQIDGAKQQFALENKLTAVYIPNAAQIQPYMGRGPSGSFPVCPAGGTYTLGRIDQAPTCTIPGHALQ